MARMQRQTRQKITLGRINTNAGFSDVSGGLGRMANQASQVSGMLMNKRKEI